MTDCVCCPFAFTDKSEQAQNYGCLPTPHEIIEMRQEHGKTWACHANHELPCIGAIRHMKYLNKQYGKNLEFKIIDPVLVTETDDWSIYLRN